MKSWPSGIAGDGMPASTKALRHAYNRKRRKRLIEQGVCVTCGWREVVPGWTQCQFCYDRWKESAEKSDPGGERRRERARRQRAERIAAGICTECGTRKATEGMRMCERCREMRNDSTRKYKIHQRTLKIEAGEMKPVSSGKGRHYTRG